jgi:glycosyltransferase involved in cell wall biosynthesis
MRKFNPVAVHAHFGECGPAGLTLAKSLGVPLVVTFHGRDATITDEIASRSWRGREYLRGRAELIESAACVIAVSEFIRSKVIEQGFRQEQVITHYNGVDARLYTPVTIERAPFVLFVGRFVEKKGCYYLLSALSHLRRRRNVRAVLVGDGPLRSQLESYARAESIQAEFPGFAAPAQVRDWMNRAAVVVVPSVTGRDGDCEGLPTVVLEAQAMATPIIATRHSGIPEGVIDGETAMLVPEKDSSRLSEAIADVLDNPARARLMGEAGRRFVKQRFSIEAQVSGLEDIYERIRSERPGTMRVA